MAEKANSSTIVVPEWLTAPFLEKHLRSYFQDEELKVVNFVTAMATGKGENYASLLFRVKTMFAHGSTHASTKGIVSSLKFQLHVCASKFVQLYWDFRLSNRTRKVHNICSKPWAKRRSKIFKLHYSWFFYMPKIFINLVLFQRIPIRKRWASS